MKTACGATREIRDTGDPPAGLQHGRAATDPACVEVMHENG
ncbi:MAG: hypothetical protein ABFD70_13895 [Syntrophaceae bacterium]